MIILLLGAGLRIAYLSDHRVSPEFEFPPLDGAFHDYWATSLTTGDWAPPSGYPDPEIATTPFFRPPGYSYFLSLIYRFSGPSILAATVVQLVLGLVSAWLAFLLGRYLFGGAAGLILAALMSGYWAFIYFEGELLAPALLVPLFLTLILVLRTWTDRMTWPRVIAAGVLFGAIALTRPNVLLCLPVVLLWSWWIARRRGSTLKGLAMAAGFALVAVLTIAPVTLRNYRVAEDFVLVSSNGGINLYIGNNPKSDGMWPAVPVLDALIHKTGWTCFDQPLIVQGVERLTGRTMKHSEVSSFFADLATDFAVEHPGQWAALTLRKALLFWGPAEISNNKVIHYEKASSPVLHFGLTFPMVLSLGVLGLVTLFLDRRSGRLWQQTTADEAGKRTEVLVLIAGLCLVYFLSYLPFFAAGRFRVPLLPFVLLFASYGLLRFGQSIRDRAAPRVLLSVVVLLTAYALAAAQAVPYEPELSQWHHGRATAYKLRATASTDREEQRELLMQAVEEYQQAVAADDARYWNHNDFAVLLSGLGRKEEAIEHYRQTIRLKPDFAQAHFNLGTLLLGQGRFQEATLPLREAVRWNPDYLKAHANLATAYLRLGREGEAMVALGEVLRLDPGDLNSRRVLGVLEARQGRRAIP